MWNIKHIRYSFKTVVNLVNVCKNTCINIFFDDGTFCIMQQQSYRGCWDGTCAAKVKNINTMKCAGLVTLLLHFSNVLLWFDLSPEKKKWKNVILQFAVIKEQFQPVSHTQTTQFCLVSQLVAELNLTICVSSSHVLTWICFDVVHLVEVFRDEKLLIDKQTHTQKTSFKSNNCPDPTGS